MPFPMRFAHESGQWIRASARVQTSAESRVQFKSSAKPVRTETTYPGKIV